MTSLENASKEIKTYFLLSFTKELIKNSTQKAKISENILKNKVNKIIKKKEINSQFNQSIPIPALKKLIPAQPFMPKINRTMLHPIPVNFPRNTSLPMTVRNIRPQPQYIQVDLAKLNPMIKDPTVNSIIINGPDENVIVRRGSEKQD